ncbi:unnamed protein product, partial [marine sediment metagenome]
MNSKEVYRADKLINHLDRIVEFSQKGVTYPIEVDFDLTDKCNQKCPKCVTR